MIHDGDWIFTSMAAKIKATTFTTVFPIITSNDSQVSTLALTLSVNEPLIEDINPNTQCYFLNCKSDIKLQEWQNWAGLQLHSFSLQLMVEGRPPF